MKWVIGGGLALLAVNLIVVAAVVWVAATVVKAVFNIR